MSNAVLEIPGISVDKDLMSTNVVNLDALIPREDFSVLDDSAPVSTIEKIDIHHLDAHFFLTGLRKPDFQRETVHWTPDKVVDLISAFINGKLIPAVILWQAGRFVFVIDGAHRLSALIAWVHDDYGDGHKSLKFFNNRISDDQRKIAEKTRKAVKSEIGAYAEYKAVNTNPQNVSGAIREKASKLGVTCITAQWVTANDAKAAEVSYFKINQAATPIDPTERRILQARQSPNAIAARVITRAGTGHKYWSDFEESRQQKIEELGHHIYKALYEPPMEDGPIKTLDLPMAGRGYNVLPFVFDLVNQTNGVKKAESNKDDLEKDENGEKTITFLANVKRHVDRISGNTSNSLGAHPVVYFYTQGGAFQPSAFLAFDLFVDSIDADGKLKSFLEAREELEGFLIAHKEHLGHIVHKYGSSHRSVIPIAEYFKTIFQFIRQGKNGESLRESLKAEQNYQFLFAPRPSNYRSSVKGGGKEFGRNTKSASFIKEAMEYSTKCSICRGLTHRNSIQIDHKQKKELGGSSDMRNAQITHPYCNSTKG